MLSFVDASRDAGQLSTDPNQKSFYLRGFVH